MKNFKIIYGISVCFILVSLISAFIPIISNSRNDNSVKMHKTTILNSEKLLNISKYNDYATWNLTVDLRYIKKYVSSYIIDKQDNLKDAIIGNSKLKNEISESSIYKIEKYSPSHRKRYYQQADATISNSNILLKAENKNLSKIINIITNHPFTYSLYLSQSKLIIPNINFFIKKHKTKKKKNLINHITYGINSSNATLNSISINSEEDVVGAKGASIAGSRLLKTVFQNISFKAPIITFDTSINEYKIAKATTKYIATKKKSNYLTNSESINNNDKHLFLNNSNNNFNNNFNIKNLLTSIYSYDSNILIKKKKKFNKHYYPKYFRFHIKLGKSLINFKHIASYKYNKTLYDSLSGIGGLIGHYLAIGISGVIIHKIRKYKIKKRKEAGNYEGLDEAVEDLLKS